MRWKWSSGATTVVAAAALALPLAVMAPAGSAHAAVPTGFGTVEYATGVPGGELIDFAFTPDGRAYFALGRNGTVTWSSDGATRQLGRVRIQGGDLGALSLEVGHDYGHAGAAPTLWIAYVAPGSPQGTNTVSRFALTLDAIGQPIGLGAETPVLRFENRTARPGIGSAVVDRDGTVWVSTGDGASPSTMDRRAFDAQKADSPYGRVLHIDGQGRGVASNPGYAAGSPASWASRTYATGFRDPFRMRLHPDLGLPLVGDRGRTTYEEHNVVRRGGAYGWPCFEGQSLTADYAGQPECRGVVNTAPLVDYARGSGMGAATVGGVLYRGVDYPSDYLGRYFFADSDAGRIYTLQPNDTATRMVTHPDSRGWATSVGTPVSLKYAPRGDVAYADRASSTIRRITSTASNHDPEATAEYRTGPGTGEVAFAVRAWDPDGDTLTYAWDFGDGATSTEANPTHRYAGPGPFAASVRVSDGRGRSTTAAVQVFRDNGTPTLNLTAPPRDRAFAVGETLELSATASDPEDGALTDIEWTTVIESCIGDVDCSRTETTSQGSTYTEPFAVGGDRATYTITARATDTQGATVSQTYVARPKLRSLTVTNNAGTAVSVNGSRGAVRQVAVGASVGLAAPRGAEGYGFERWSDGVAGESRRLTMPDADISFQAVYSSEISRRYDREPALQRTLGAPVGPEIGEVNGRRQVYERGHAYYHVNHGVHEVHGLILDRYLAEGGLTRLGVPSSDEIVTPDGKGRMNTFAGTSRHPNPVIYYRADTGARLVVGSIQAQYQAMNSTRGVHGFPRSSEASTPDGRGRYNDFQNGGIYWSPGTGARSVYGAIYDTWARFGWEGGHLRLPTTSETGTPDRIGRYNHFEGGSVYWSPRTGAHEVRGLIRDEWARRGWERSSLGYPTSDEFAVPGGRRSNFERGHIEWSNGRLTVVSS